MKTGVSQECLCAKGKKMIIYSKEEMCKLLNIDGESEVFQFLQNEIKKRPVSGQMSLGELVDYYLENYIKCRSFCGVLPSTITNQGFYIKPKENLNHLNNELTFSPLYSMVNSSRNCYSTYKGEAQIPKSSAISAGMPGPEICEGDLLAYTMNSNNFYHHDFQYSAQFNDFGEAFISYYDLFMLVNFSEYVGIVGAKVSSGKFLVDDDDNMNIDNKFCNKDYFTYRLVAFNTVTCDDINNLEQIVLNKANRSSNGVDPEIPAETWAVPCPPRWRPQ